MEIPAFFGTLALVLMSSEIAMLGYLLLRL